MFKNLFKTKLQRLQDKYKLLLRKSFEASKTDRTLSDQYLSQASEIEDKILEIQEKS